MKLKFKSVNRSLLYLIMEEMNPEQDLFLVGGAVRDALLGQKNHDMDFAMAENPTKLAKRVANRLKVGIFVLDDDRYTARVLYRDPDGDLSPLDFVMFTGNSLREDLENRDFTINAMAFSIRDLSTLIDPLGGQGDLNRGIIRACSENALLDDPVRVLRGIRLALQFNFDYAHSLKARMCDAAGHLPETSYERQRDEFFRILEGPQPVLGMRHCRDFGVFETLIPPLVDQTGVPASSPHVLPLFEHTLGVVEYYGQLLQRLYPNAITMEHAPWWLDRAVSVLNQFSPEIQAYFEDEIIPGRSKHALALFGALLHDIGKTLTLKVGEEERYHYNGHDRAGADLAYSAARRLQLSNAESEWLQILVRDHMRLLPMVNTEGVPSRRAIYRFFHQAGEVGVAIIFLSLADTAATYGPTLSESKWEQAVLIAKVLLSAWWEQQESVVAPVPMLDGNDLQKLFGLEPGKRIGQLLRDLVEAQAAGEVKNEKEAKVFIQTRLGKDVLNS